MIFANRNVEGRNNVSRPRQDLKPDHGKSYSNFRLSVRQVNTLTWGRDMPKIRYKVMRLNTLLELSDRLGPTTVLLSKQKLAVRNSNYKGVAFKKLLLLRLWSKFPMEGWKSKK